MNRFKGSEFLVGGWVVAFSFVATTLAPQQSMAGERSLSDQIISACTVVSAQSEQRQRLSTMQATVVTVLKAESGARDTVDDDAIRCVTEWLSHSDDYSKMNAAMILSRLPCRSKAALPALRAALQHMEFLPLPAGDISLGPSVSPTDSVETAITVIERANACDRGMKVAAGRQDEADSASEISIEKFEESSDCSDYWHAMVGEWVAAGAPADDLLSMRRFVAEDESAFSALVRKVWLESPARFSEDSVMSVPSSDELRAIATALDSVSDAEAGECGYAWLEPALGNGFLSPNRKRIASWLPADVLEQNGMLGTAASRYVLFWLLVSDAGPAPAAQMSALSCAINKAMAVAVENGFDQQRVVIETNPRQGAGSVFVEIASPATRGGGFEVEVRTEDCEVVDVVWLQ